MQKTILFMDNNAEFLDVHSRLLEYANYNVFKAYSIEEAEKKLNQEHIHMAVFDIRMIDDDDENDISGLLMAKKEEYRYLPKIIFTAYPDYEYVREALGFKDGYQPAIDFLSKDEGIDKLIETVDRAFEKHVHVNWNMNIKFDDSEHLSFQKLSSIFSDSDTCLLENRKIEIQELFKRLFYKKSGINIEKILWQRQKEGRICIMVSADSEQFKVVFGLNIPGSQQGIASCKELDSDIKQYSASTLHFSAMAYAMSGETGGRINTKEQGTGNGKKRS